MMRPTTIKFRSMKLTMKFGMEMFFSSEKKENGSVPSLLRMCDAGVFPLPRSSGSQRPSHIRMSLKLEVTPGVKVYKDKVLT